MKRRERRLDLRLPDIRGDHDLDHCPVGRWPDHDRLVRIAVEEVDPEPGPAVDLLVRGRDDGDPARPGRPGLVLVREELRGQGGCPEDRELEAGKGGPARRVDRPDPAPELRFADPRVPQRSHRGLRAEAPGVAAVRRLAVELERDPRLEVGVGALHLLAVDAAAWRGRVERWRGRRACARRDENGCGDKAETSPGERAQHAISVPGPTGGCRTAGWQHSRGARPRDPVPAVTWY